MGNEVVKKYVNVERELDFYEFKRILENVETMWETINKAESIGIDLSGRQFRDSMNDILLMLASLLDDRDNLIPYFCWTKDFGKEDDELTVEGLWNILTEEI